MASRQKRTKKQQNRKPAECFICADPIASGRSSTCIKKGMQCRYSAVKVLMTMFQFLRLPEILATATEELRGCARCLVRYGKTFNPDKYSILAKATANATNQIVNKRTKLGHLSYARILEDMKDGINDISDSLDNSIFLKKDDGKTALRVLRSTIMQHIEKMKRQSEFDKPVPGNTFPEAQNSSFKNPNATKAVHKVSNPSGTESNSENDPTGLRRSKRLIRKANPNSVEASQDDVVVLTPNQECSEDLELEPDVSSEKLCQRAQKRGSEAAIVEHVPKHRKTDTATEEQNDGHADIASEEEAERNLNLRADSFQVRNRGYKRSATTPESEECPDEDVVLRKRRRWSRESPEKRKYCACDQRLNPNSPVPDADTDESDSEEDAADSVYEYVDLSSTEPSSEEEDVPDKTAEFHTTKPEQAVSIVSISEQAVLTGEDNHSQQISSCTEAELTLDDAILLLNLVESGQYDVPAALVPAPGFVLNDAQETTVPVLGSIQNGLLETAVPAQENSCQSVTIDDLEAPNHTGLVESTGNSVAQMKTIALSSVDEEKIQFVNKWFTDISAINENALPYQEPIDASLPNDFIPQFDFLLDDLVSLEITGLYSGTLTANENGHQDTSTTAVTAANPDHTDACAKDSPAPASQDLSVTQTEPANSMDIPTADVEPGMLEVIQPVESDKPKSTSSNSTEIDTSPSFKKSTRGTKRHFQLRTKDLKAQQPADSAEPDDQEESMTFYSLDKSQSAAIELTSGATTTNSNTLPISQADSVDLTSDMDLDPQLNVVPKMDDQFAEGRVTALTTIMDLGLELSEYSQTVSELPIVTAEAGETEMLTIIVYKSSGVSQSTEPLECANAEVVNPPHELNVYFEKEILGYSAPGVSTRSMDLRSATSQLKRVTSTPVYARCSVPGCSFQYDTTTEADLLSAHIRRKHQGIAKCYVCSVCDAGFKDRKSLETHMYRHSGKRPFACHVKDCDKRFRSQRQQRAHHLLHHQPENCPYTCPDCGKKYVKKYNFELHLRSHTGETPLQCEHCGLQFPGASSLRNHHLKAHQDDPNVARYQCEQCGKVLASSQALNCHKLKIHGENAVMKAPVCQFKGCGYVSANGEKGLQRHMNMMHSERRPEQCEVCGQCFKTKSTHDSHFRSIHLDQRPHECPTCGKSFIVPSKLARHMKSHTGEKNFACGIGVCPKTFYDQPTANRHRRLTHPGKSLSADSEERCHTATSKRQTETGSRKPRKRNRIIFHQSEDSSRPPVEVAPIPIPLDDMASEEPAENQKLPDVVNKFMSEMLMDYVEDEEENTDSV